MQKRRLRNRNGVFFLANLFLRVIRQTSSRRKTKFKNKKNRLQTLRLEANPKIHTHQADKKPPTGMSIIMRLLFATAFFRAFFCGSFFCGSFQCAFACAFFCGSRLLCHSFFSGCFFCNGFLCGSRFLCHSFFSGRFLCYGFLCGSRFLCHYFFCNRLFCGSFFCYFFCCHDFYVFWFIYSHCPSGRKH